MLFVPGNRPVMASKATRSNPHVVVLDLEDAVPPADKAGARRMVQEAAESLVGLVPVCVRVNAPSTPWFEDDVACLPDGLTAVVVPKLESVAQCHDVARALDGRSLVAGLETVRGVADARLLLGPPVVACYFGAEDYVADLGGVRTPSNDEVTVPRSLVAMAARLAGVAALDMVTLDFGDEERFVQEARTARSLGYVGKMCVHPAQVQLANDAFRPTREESEWALRLLTAFDQTGGATIAFEGLMVDEVVAARARAIVAAGEDP
jgi:citrate lyase subunit beta/citryl-CoA lyase